MLRRERSKSGTTPPEAEEKAKVLRVVEMGLERRSSGLEAREGRNLALSASMATLVSTVLLGGPSEPSSASSTSSSPSSSSSSPASPASNTSFPLPSTPRWFMRRPPAPPSSKSALVFLKSGSTENSRSSFLVDNDAKDGARVLVAR